LLGDQRSRAAKGARPKMNGFTEDILKDYDSMVVIWFEDLGLGRDNTMVELNRHLHVIYACCEIGVVLKLSPNQPRLQLAIMTGRALKVPQISQVFLLLLDSWSNEPNMFFISQAELLSFYEAHFSTAATAHFAASFLQPTDSTTAAEPTAAHEYEPTNWNENEDELEYEECEEHDDLGYYPDGVRRTLTDEQIAIFRHSELEALRRKHEGEGEHKRDSTSSKMDSDKETNAELSEGEVSEGEGPSTPAMLRATSGGLAVGSTKSSEHGNGNTNGAANGNGNGGKNGNGNSNFKKKKKKRKRAGNPSSGNNSGRTDELPIDLRKRTWDVVETGLATLDYDDDEQETAPRAGMMRRKQILYED